MSTNHLPVKTYWQWFRPNGKHVPGPIVRVTVQATHPADATKIMEAQYGKDKLDGPALPE